MSNLLTKFPSRLAKVTHSLAKNGKHIYTAAFEDGSIHVIRTGGILYRSVAQCWYYKPEHGNTEFLFTRKPVQASVMTGLRAAERARHIVTLTIQEAIRS